MLALFHQAAGPALWLSMMVLYMILAASSLVVMYQTRENQTSQLRLQILAWWRIFPVISLSLFFYPYGLMLLTILIGALSLRELAQHYRGPSHFFWLMCSAVLALFSGVAYLPVRYYLIFPAFLILLQTLRFSLRRETNQLLLLLFFCCCYGVGFVFQFTQLPLAADAAVNWLFYLFALTALNDIAQFISGKLFGRQKIARRISPNKTWQGLAGGVIVSTVVSLVLGNYLHLADNGELLIFAWLLSLGGLAGDLGFSAAKRFLGIKDFSQLIPGHGGILDRVDSLIVTAPLLYLGVYFSHYGL